MLYRYNLEKCGEFEVLKALHLKEFEAENMHDLQLKTDALEEGFGELGISEECLHNYAEVLSDGEWKLADFL